MGSKGECGLVLLGSEYRLAVGTLTTVMDLRDFLSVRAPNSLSWRVKFHRVCI